MRYCERKVEERCKICCEKREERGRGTGLIICSLIEKPGSCQGVHEVTIPAQSVSENP
jgi:hypothetical protein